MQNILYIIAIYVPVTFSCAFGSENGNRPNIGNNNIPWHRKKLTHDGKKLSIQDLSKLASMADEIHFKNVLSPIMVPRVVNTASHTKVRKHIKLEMEKLGWIIEEDQFQDDTPYGRELFTNIIATLDSSAERRLVLACHYDSKLEPTGFIGATDSAVPCAMLINLASTMKTYLDAHTDKDLTLQFIFFDGEEALKSWSYSDSLYGSRHLASKLDKLSFPVGNKYGTTELNRMDLFLLLDLIGTNEVRFISFFKNTDRWFERLQLYETNMRQLNLIMNKRVPDFMKLNNRVFRGGVEDDHIPFLQKGVPILHLITVPFPRVWHKKSDNKDSLNYAVIKDMNLYMRAFVADYLALEL